MMSHKRAEWVRLASQITNRQDLRRTEENLIREERDCTPAPVLHVPGGGRLSVHRRTENQRGGLIEGPAHNDVVVPRGVSVRLPADQAAVAFDKPELS